MSNNTNVRQINFYSDESCHLQFDDNSVMTLAAVYCSKGRVKNISSSIRSLKHKYGINPYTELKWKKVSPCNLSMYKEIVDYIAGNTVIKIRVIIAKHKKEIISNEGVFGSYDSWYSKMYYTLLKYPLEMIPFYKDYDVVNLFIDKKDTLSKERNNNLAKYLAYTTPQKFIRTFVSDSKEHELIQIADIIAGAASYSYRDKQVSEAKRILAEYIQKKLRIDFMNTSKLRDYRANVFIWNGRDF